MCIYFFIRYTLTLRFHWCYCRWLLTGSSNWLVPHLLLGDEQGWTHLLKPTPTFFHFSLLVSTAGCLSLGVQNDTCAEFNTSRLFSHLLKAVLVENSVLRERLETPQIVWKPILNQYATYLPLCVSSGDMCQPVSKATKSSTVSSTWNCSFILIV